MKRPVRFLFFLCLIGLGLGLSYVYWRGSGRSAHREDMLSTWGLGRHLAREFPGCHVLVVSNPFADQKRVSRAIVRQEESRIAGLREAFGQDAASFQVAYPELKPGALDNPQGLVLDPGTTTPLSFLVVSNAFERLLELHPEANLVISLVGIPHQIQSSPAWNTPGSRRFAFLFPDLRFLGGAGEVRQAVADGPVAAFVLNQPGAAVEDLKVKRFSEEEFERYYLLVHRGNVDAVLQQWGRLIVR